MKLWRKLGTMNNYSSEELIEAIDLCHERNGKVNGKIINDEDDLPCQKTFYNHFGSMKTAVEEAGYNLFHSQKKEKVEIECNFCNETQKIYPHRAEKLNYELQNCKNCMDKKVKVQCSNSSCSSKILRHKYQVEDHNVFWCSGECESEWKTGRRTGEEHPRWNPDKKNYSYRNGWEEKREKAIMRDDFKCLKCGITREEHYEKFGRDIQVHHVVPHRKFVEEDYLERSNAHNLDNLETYCAVCHRVIENA